MKSIVGLLLLGLALGQQFVPIPSRQFGIVLPRESKTTPALDYEVFLDLLCSDSKAFLPEWEKFLAYEVKGVKVSEIVRVTYHLTTLPYHYDSFFTLKLSDFV